MIATALREALRKGYTGADLRADLLSGAVVGVVALPLSMALAIAVGAPPQHGLYTAIIAGALTALLGGCTYQVTGPTAAFVVILAPIVSRFGLSGLLTAGFMAGILLVVLGLAKLGDLIKYIPYPVTTGFTTGIAVVIATLQLKDALGLQVAKMPEHYHEKVLALWEARGTASVTEAGVAAVTLALLLLVPRVLQRVPAPLVALVAVTAVTALLTHVVPGFEVATIGSRFQTTIDGVVYRGIPPVLPAPELPWSHTAIDFETVKQLAASAFAIAMLGAIESLLSAVIADGMTGSRHDPNAELVGLGVGNIVAPFFGGIAATGALARTATNIRAGARSPLSAVFHALVVLGAMLALAPLVAWVPMAALAGLLLLVAWNMSEVRHFVGLFRYAPKSDLSVLLLCFFLTVAFDMVVAVSVGFGLAAILFMRRMAEITEARLTLDRTEEVADVPLPRSTALYEVNGPLFFGAAQKAMDTLQAAHTDDVAFFILDLGRVPVIDATGFAALKNTLDGLHKRGKAVILAGPLPKPQRLWERADLPRTMPHVHVAPSVEAAIAEAARRAGPAPHPRGRRR